MQETKKIYAEKIFNLITCSESLDEFYTTRHNELDDKFYSLVKSVSRAVEPCLADAVLTLYEVARSVIASAYDCGQARGIQIAMAMQNILERPLEVAECVDNNAVPVCDSLKYEIDAIIKCLAEKGDVA